MKSRTMAFAATAKQLHYTNFTTIASGELTEFIEDYKILTITELIEEDLPCCLQVYLTYQNSPPRTLP